MHKCIYNHLQPFDQDGDSRRDNKCECVKGAMEGQTLPLIIAVIAMQMQCECIKGALALYRVLLAVCVLGSPVGTWGEIVLMQPLADYKTRENEVGLA